MHVTSKPSHDAFLPPRAATPAPTGNGDNASFARLMQQRHDQAAAAPAAKPAPGPSARHADSNYNAAPRQSASTSDAKAQAPRSTADSDSAKTRSSQADTTQSSTDAHMLAARKAQSTKLAKPASASGKSTADSASTTDPIKSSDTTDTTDATGTSPADWAAQWAGITPKQAPVASPADPGNGASGANGAAVSPPSRMPIEASALPIRAIGIGGGIAGNGEIKQPGFGIAAPGDPASPVGTPLSADSNPISLTPTNGLALKAEKNATSLATEDATSLSMLQTNALAMSQASEARKDDKAGSSHATTGDDGTIGAAAAVAGTSHAPSQTSDAPTVQIATPVHAPEFKEALGIQISMMARDGIQHAELHLNPADMGPISVQIATEGTQARVDFGADSAVTRHILETGMPELASALQNAGMTLTGGGVSQHAQGGSQNSDSRDESRGSRRVTMGVEGASTLGTSTVSRAPRGALDLYA